MAIEVYDLRTSYGFSGFDIFESCFRIYEFTREELEGVEFYVWTCFIVVPFLAKDNNPPFEADFVSSWTDPSFGK